MKKLNSIKLKHGVVAIGLTIAVIIGIVLINLIFIKLSNKMSLKIDMTKTGYNSLSEENASLIKKFTDDIVITVLSSEKNFLSSESLAESSIADESQDGYHTQAIKFLEEYQKINSHIKVSYIDSQSPDFSAFVKKYPSETLNAGDVLVECKESMQILTVDDLLDTTQNEYYFTINNSKIESALTSAIIKVSGNGPIKGEIILGHNADKSESLLSLLSGNNFNISEIASLEFSDISDESRVLILNTPTSDFSKNEIEKLNGFMKEDKNLFIYIADSSQPSLPNLEKFLKDFGIVPMNGVIFESDETRYINDNYFTFFDYLGSSYENLATKGLFSLTYAHRPFELIEDPKDTTVTHLLSTPSTSFLYPISENAEKEFKTEDAEKGPFYGALLSEKKNGKNTSAIFAIGSKNFFRSQVMTHQAYGNAEFMMLTVNKALDTKDESIYFAPKAIGTESKLIDARVSGLVGTWLFMVFLPLTVLSFGIYIWIRRSTR